jgi:Tfp pilus assembly protein FimV
VPASTSNAGAASADEPSGPGAGVATRTFYVAQPGDTLWSIARRLQPDGDIRALVDALVRINGGAALDVGQRVLIP